MSVIEKLDSVLALAEKATPGQWQSKNEREWDEIIGNIDGPDDGHFYYTHICSVDMLDLQTPEQRANAKLIAATINLLRDHGPAIRQDMIDAERIKRDIEELYDVMPMLPITAETMDAATDWFTRYCIDFYREINAVQDAAIDARLASDSEGVPARRRNPMEWDARATGEGEGHD